MPSERTASEPVGHDIIVVGASAGGVETLTRLCGLLPGSFPAAVFIVLHIQPQAKSVLPQILDRAGALPAAHAVDGDPIQGGRIYIAPPDHHLLIETQAGTPGRVRVLRGPKENRSRPAIDPLFRSAAAACGPRVVGVVLSGSLDDGSAGLVAIRRGGGVTIVQDPEDALYPGMPRSALAALRPDHCLPLEAIAPILCELAAAPADDPPGEDPDQQVEVVKMSPTLMESDDRNGQPSPYSCPECGGVLWEMTDGDLLRFRCRVGHAFSPGSMLAEQSEATERALWVALKILEERVSLLRRMHDGAIERGMAVSREHLREQLREAEVRAASVRRVLLRGEPQALEPPVGGAPPPADDLEGQG